MTSSEKDSLFHKKTVITNFNCKLSSSTTYDANKQILCLISNENEILLRYSNKNGLIVYKIISWFKKNEKIIHDVCFDPMGSWLLVLCFDNTLHLVPALKLVDSSQIIQNTAFSLNEITSFIIPFIGPHECPNPKVCPNGTFNNTTNNTATNLSSPFRLIDTIFDQSIQNEQQQSSQNDDNKIPIINKNEDKNYEYYYQYSIRDSDLAPSPSSSPSQQQLPSNVLNQENLLNQKRLIKNENDDESFLIAACTCPYPKCVVWWQTIDKRNRAIIGYSDGSICIVGLTPNCPFIGNTTIENGAMITKLIICRDNNNENVTLLINSSLKEQWKLLLEQKSIKYIFPSDTSSLSSLSSSSSSSLSSSATAAQQQQYNLGNGRDDDWTFVTHVTAPSSNVTASTTINSNTNEKSFDQRSTAAIDENTSSSSPNQLAILQLLDMNNENSTSTSALTTLNKGILPAARARLSLLKNLGTKKLNAFKLKLSDAKSKLDEYMSEESLNSFVTIDSPTTVPEILTTSNGPYYSSQNLRNTFLLSALHKNSNILSIHRMDLKLIPLFHYKIPIYCQHIMICSNLLYSIQLVELNKIKNQNIENKNDDMFNCDEKDIVILNDDDNNTDDNNKKKLINCIGVISSAMASIKTGDVTEFNEKGLLGLFRFPNEKILDIHCMITYNNNDNNFDRINNSTANDKNNPLNNDTTTATATTAYNSSNYIRLYRNFRREDEVINYDFNIIKKEFPKINYDPCIVVTNKNTYLIELTKEPYKFFLNAAMNNNWELCKEFCTTFDLSFSQCIEFIGDYLLRNKQVTKALITYNIAQIPPVRTALKLSIYGENYALMHLCAMALKCIYIIKSKYCINNNYIKYLLINYEQRYCINIKTIIQSLQYHSGDDNEIINDGKLCSNYSYNSNELLSSLQMSTSSQFHLSNLLLIALVERAVKEKFYNLAVWNFIATNTKFHTNMTSVVLCQSGFYMAALLLAMIRGCCIDVFVGLVSVSHQEFGWYSEINVIFYNLSENIFCECITYLRHVSADYFNVIQKKLNKFDKNVLQRLESQLNPFTTVFRPIISHRFLNSSPIIDGNNDTELLDFSKLLIETYLAILLQLNVMKSKSPNIFNALNTFRISYEDNQFAIKTSNYPPISVGYSHSACVIDGCAYFWGSNGIPCVYNVGKPIDPPEPPHAVKYLEILAQLNLEVHAVKCGRQHSLILTNNGLYAFGSNAFGQLGINKKMNIALQPMLVENLDCKDITILEAGQYHNAAVADGKLFTWGWGTYGQLGHGDIENVYKPKIVEFFIDKKVIQVSLGHSHSLVLCSTKHGNNELYVFGSNHFGQLGILYKPNEMILMNKNQRSPSILYYPIKYLLPKRIEVSSSNIRLIHTKFFCNFVVNDDNELYTWGLSPQALRLTNQVKRRVNTKQKIEETLKKEINKRNEKELIALEENNRSDNAASSSSSSSMQTFTPIPNGSNPTLNPQPTTSLTSIPLSNSNKISKNEFSDSSGESDSLSSQPQNSTSNIKKSDTKTIDAVIDEIKELKIDEEEGLKFDNNKPNTVTNKENEKQQKLTDNLNKINENEMMKKSQQQQNTINENENFEHIIPQKVDTSEVSGKILQVSSGLLHFALISSTSMLFTWGKNLEHQLGTEDKERKPVNKPTPLESIDNPMHVECGADFTIVITHDYVVKAFGGNANGQCGRDLSPPSSDKVKTVKLFCLPTTKRLMRLENNCVESPIDINLPRPQIRMDFEPIRYIKCIPKYNRSYLIKSSIASEFNLIKFVPEDNGGGVGGGACSDNDCISSIENISLLDEDDDDSIADSVNNDNDSISSTNYVVKNSVSFHNFDNLSSTFNTDGGTGTAAGTSSSTTENDNDNDINDLRNYIHYCLYIFHGLYDPKMISNLTNLNIEYRIRILMLNYNYIDAFINCLNELPNITAQKSIKLFEYFTKDPNIVPMKRNDLKVFIYHLFNYFLYKKYDMTECENFFLLNLDYYLLDLSYVMYFNNNNNNNNNNNTNNNNNNNNNSKNSNNNNNNVNNNSNLNNFNEKTNHISTNVSTETATVTNKNDLECKLNQKFKTFFLYNVNDDNNVTIQDCKFENTELIFDMLSIKFKAIVCQRLLQIYKND